MNKKQRILNALSQKDVDKLKENDNIESAIALFLCYTGLRVSELCDLQWKDVDFDNKEFKVVKGKNSKERTVPLLDYTIKILKDIKKRLDSKVYILETSTGKKYHRQYINNACKKLDKKYYPHLFRHTFATLLFRNGVEAKIVQTILGHESINTTLDIYTHPTKEDLKESIRILV